MFAADTAFDPALPWRRSPSVAMRPEPFGALVYSFSTRKLSFLKSRPLVAVIEALGEHPSAAAALTACGIAEADRGSYERALADLARSRMIEVRTSLPHTPRALGASPCSEADPAEAP